MDRVIAKIKKSAVSEVWVVLTDFTGELRIDVREYFHVGPGAFHPTRKGVSIPAAGIRALRDALEVLAEASDVGTVATINRSERAAVQAGIRNFEGHTYAELRVFIPGPTPDAPWRPTPKGFTLKPSLVPLLAEAIGEAGELVVDGGPEQAARDRKRHKAGTEPVRSQQSKRRNDGGREASRDQD